ncbi:transcriptional regulator GutM [Enterococcus mundtii]|uniref:transcriptional regulator GutM n=1 Tax=Enterococcus mundtii TaxID=53346 RepID=UPI001CF217AE|nr:transcriptional regulator GutM [Enterococcus mundtii]MCA6775370.1 transcriptional regulator GutM [Enterococcus mundtii]
MQGLIIIATLIIACQVFLSLYQIRYYNRFMRNLVNRFDNCSGYTLNTEIEKNWYSSVVLVVITDSHDLIIEAYVYSGLTIFSRFKAYESLKGKTISQDLKEEFDHKKSSLKQRVVYSFLIKKMKPIT